MPSINFLSESHKRVLQQAQQYRNTINTQIKLPLEQKKAQHVQKNADDLLTNIKYSIQRANYQNETFRKLQKMDQQYRQKMSKSLVLKQTKAQQNNKKNTQKYIKKHEIYDKHFNQVKKRYQQQEKKKFKQQKQQANKLRNELKQFYAQEQVRRKQKNHKQVSVTTCYQSALQKLQKIQKANQQASKKAQIQLEKSFERSNNFRNSATFSMRSSSFDFNKHEKIYENSMDLILQNQQKFIQKYGKNQLSSSRAFIHKEEQNQKVKKRISQFLKKRTDKWKQQKKRVEQKKKQIPTKCTQKLNRTMNSQFRNTFSGFRDSFLSWRSNVQQNKSLIKQKDQRDKEKIMDIHTNISLKNKSIKQIQQKMFSMKHRASKVAAQFC